MKLRMRLTVTTVAVTLPMIAALIALDARARHSAAEEALTTVALRHMLQAGERERCEATAPTWGGNPLPRPPQGEPRPEPPPWAAPPRDEQAPAGMPPGFPPRDGRAHTGMPPVLFAYDESLRSQNPLAPALTGAIAEAIKGRDVATSPSAWRGSAVDVLVRMPWSRGPCAFVLVRGTTGPGWLGSILPASRIWLAPMIVIFVALLLAVGPVIRRIRKLTEDVRRSAAAGFTEPVTVLGRDEIAELGRAFDAAAREVRAQLAAKDVREQALRRFLANTTHDVMIPLTVLKAHLTTLQERAQSGEPFDMAVLISAMDEAHYLASLVHNLGIAAKLEAGEPELQREAVDLNALVGRVMGRHGPIARQLQVAIDSSVPEPPIVTDADVTLLEQAVSNIVYNAIRYNRPGGHVAVILERTSEGRFRLRVLDDGPGIPAADLARLAERGRRGDHARTRAPEGQGLGLHIATRVAELHGLTLTLQPSEYGGLQVDIEGECEAQKN